MICSSCGVDKTITVELDGYRLCRRCAGRDIETRRPFTPTELPAAAPATLCATPAAVPAQPQAAQQQLGSNVDARSWDGLRASVAKRDAERAARRGGAR